jgi:hypothetical protein
MRCAASWVSLLRVGDTSLDRILKRPIRTTRCLHRMSALRNLFLQILEDR